MKNKDYILYLDLDGVLVDFDGGYRKLSQGRSIQETAAADGEDSAREKYLKAKADWWANLDWIHGGRELFNASDKMFEHVCILSSAGTGDPEKGKAVVEGKIRWLAKNIPSMDASRTFIVFGKHLKQERSAKNAILVDDVAITIEQWNARGGFGILHKSNDYKKTIEELYDIASPISLAEMVKRFKY